VALKDLLVCVDPTDRSPVHLRLAVDLARRHGSAITALYVREWTPEQLAHRKTAELAGRSLSEISTIDRSAEDSIDRSACEMRAAFEHLAAQQGLHAEWRMIEGEPRAVVPQHARYADLCILGVDTPASSTSAGYRFSEEMLFASGRPMLLLPREIGNSTLGAHVAVAWNSSRASARALSDAMPILERSEKVTVLTVNPSDIVASHGALPPRQLLEHLHRHGIAAQAAELSAVPTESVAAVLQEQAGAVGADMLVAGAHGHTWLREVLLGSVTRELLGHLQLPVMMSH